MDTDLTAIKAALAELSDAELRALIDATRSPADRDGGALANSLRSVDSSTAMRRALRAALLR